MARPGAPMPPAPHPIVKSLMDGDSTALLTELQALERMPLTPETIETFFSRWSRASELHGDAYSRLFVQTTRDTADKAAEARLSAFLESLSPEVERLEQVLTERALKSGLEPPGMALPMRRLRTDAALFNEQNQTLQTQLNQLNRRYNQVTGARTVLWEGEETTTTQLATVFQSQDRDLREAAWRLKSERQLEDRGLLAEIWRQTLDLRVRLARNSGAANFRDYRWQQLHRFDYSPRDCERFAENIAEVVVPAVSALYARRAEAMGLKRLRPWDLDADASGAARLRPFEHVEELTRRMAAVFHKVDPTLGGYFDTLLRNDMLDLENRKNKAPVGYCLRFPETGLPFIFTNAVGVQRDVQVLAHEGGHGFHAFEVRALPYIFQRSVGAEFSEVASMTMEFLTEDLLGDPEVGFYSDQDAAQARLAHLEHRLTLWPRVGLIDSFQHWIYTHPDEAMDLDACDEQWAQINKRFMPDVDWTGLEPYLRSGWESIIHIQNAPFYYVEYGLALLGAVQIWAASRTDRAQALRRYRSALALGGTASLPDLYAAAGARFTFEAKDLQMATELLLSEMDALRS